MSILEKIRSRTALLVGIIAFGLIAFILGDIINSGSALFTRQDNLLGIINGDKIEVTAFSTKVNEQIAQIQKQNPNAQVDEKMKEQIIESVWSQLINEKVLKVQYKKLGITVSDDELYDLMLVHPHQYVIQQLTDQQTGKVYEGLAKPDGTIDVVKLNQQVSSFNADQEKFWKQLEKSILEVRAAEKYNNLIKKGLYITSAEAKDAFIAQNKQVNAAFVMKRYTDVSDSTVKVSEDEISAYYNKHQNDYKVSEPSRKIEYVAYDVMPSKADYEALLKDAQRVTEEFKTKTTPAEDSSYIAQESEGGAISIANYGKKNMIIADSTVFTAPKGTVYGPYTEGTFLKVYKLSDIKSIADSAKVRHILIGLQSQRTQTQRTPEVAKRIADSLLVLLKAKTVKFDTLVKTMSDDMGSLDKGGDYGWFDENKGFVDPFKNAGLQGTVGNITVVPTQFGFHIIEVLNVSKTRHNSYTVAQISKLIAPSSETAQEYYKIASDFSGKNQTADAFNKAIETDKLNKRIAENIKEGDKALPGLEGAKDLVRWVYKSKKGEISPVFEFKDRYIVAQLVAVKEKGIAPLEDVKDDVTAKAIRDKKADAFIKEFETKAGASKSIDDIASKMGLTAEKADNLTFSAYNVAAIGREDALIGTATSMKAGATSKAIKGDNGVFVVNVASVNEPVLPKDFKGKQQEIERMNNGRVDYEMFDALKEKANIEDHRGKFDF
ncbi:MAG: SurA N-terminal domain-containing protein [Bacteroidia bacterium]|nr:SurA N-terminal domain-containing protein [Bacteroidia bacterium]